MDVKRTFLTCMDPSDLPEDFLGRVRSFKSRGSSGKLNIALDGAPEFPALPKARPACAAICISPIPSKRMERAYDDWKAGRWSADPFQDTMIPSMIDPTMTPPGKHFMSCFVQYCPPKLRNGSDGERDWTDNDRDAFGKAVPRPDRGLRARLQAAHPACRGAHPARTRGRGRPDRRQHLPGRTDLRPASLQPPGAGLCAVSRPGPDLWMCGSSTHPGGGVMGAPGRNAAAEILRSMRGGVGNRTEMRDAYPVL
jgi:phytoene dehydrogenase-like protein